VGDGVPLRLHAGTGTGHFAIASAGPIWVHRHPLRWHRRHALRGGWPCHGSPPPSQDWPPLQRPCSTPTSPRIPAYPVAPTPRFYKLDFPTFDDVVDPLNWLNQCEQFFRGQRTLASDRTWLASYHLRSAAQTWYYALERDEGMPTWERFHALCQLQFGPPTQGTRLAEHARLSFTSTVQEFSERYNVVLCHTDNDLVPCQKAKLFVGGLPEHIRVDVEMRHPPNLQTVMYYVRAFERRAAAYQALSAPPQRGPRPSPRSTLSAPTSSQVAPTAGNPGGSTPTPAAMPSRFRRLSPAEQQERRRQGLCFNCDEPYVRGHVCQRLFYLLNDDYMDDVVPAEVAAAAVFQTPVVALPDPDPEATPASTPSPQVSLHALAGVLHQLFRHHAGLLRPHPRLRLPPCSRAHPMGLCAPPHVLHPQWPTRHVAGHGRVGGRRASRQGDPHTGGPAPPGPPPGAVREHLRGAPRAATRPPLRPQDPPPARHGSSGGATILLPALAEGRA
jgi:hypothetical protein